VIHHALHISIFYFSCLLHVGGGQGTLPVLPVLVKNVMNTYKFLKLFENFLDIFLMKLKIIVFQKGRIHCTTLQTISQR
jgi:hypothetical protein